MDNPYYVKQGQKSRKKTYIIVAIVIVVIIALLAWMISSFTRSLGSLMSGDLGVTTSVKTYTPPQTGKYIAKVTVAGTIGNGGDPYSSSDASYHHDWTMKTIDTLIADKNNVALYLYIDSPGGSVYESDELYEKILEYKEANKGKRPIYVYMAHMAASGGYYIAAPATRIFANRNATTGSIGVIIGTIYDVSGFLSEHGITATDITSGPNKGMGSYFEPLTDEQRGIYQSIVDEAYDRFVSIVSEGRGMSIDDVKTIADGRIYTAAQAKENGLIDEVALNADAEQSILDMNKGATISNAVYKADHSIWNNMFAKASELLLDVKDGRGGKSDVSSVLSLIDRGELKPQLYYLYEG
ncbi:MAG: signal peptide peptidase SppA [Clostridiales Family XIII bacterium]|jgi:protease-4|nr:signal peptide peptidase SppA [Clostridiales Family XIII bacterium]